MPLGLDEMLDGVHADALSIAELYDELEGSLVRTFPKSRKLWVRGEVHSISDQARTGHCYLDLVDPESAGERQPPTLKIKCWRTTWAPIRAMLAREGIELQTGMVVVIRGSLDFYRPRAEVAFIMAELDVSALLGRLAAERAALLRTLSAEGLLNRNRTLTLPEVPLHVGLVGSPGTEGYQDFLGQLEDSGFGFRVSMVPVQVQGPRAPQALTRALTWLARSGCDIVVVVRGGGSRADLAAFDAEPVARAIATSPVPVWTGIGHTGDQSVADLVAHRSFITPTECGRELVLRVTDWWQTEVVNPAERIARSSAAVLASAQQRDNQLRGRLAAMARHLIRVQRERLGHQADALAKAAPQAIGDAHSATVRRVARLGPLALGQVDRTQERLAAWRRLFAAYDVERQLERGYTLTLDPSGKPIRSVRALRTGSELVTRFADGSARSQVMTVEAGQRTDQAMSQSEEH
jgi:exodeoxyribonuclease VII large subunit